MTFKIFKKTCELRDRNGDWDGDEGYEVEIEVPDEKIKNDLVAIVVDNYLPRMVSEREHKLICEVVGKIIDDYELVDKMKKDFFDELRAMYEEEL